MNIPDKALEAAAIDIWESRNPEFWEDADSTAQAEYLNDAKIAIKAAAPFIAAQALRDLHGRIGELEDQDIEAIAEYIWFRSNLLDPQ